MREESSGRWLLSTFLSAAGAGLALVVIILGWTETGEHALSAPRLASAAGGQWAVPRADRLPTLSDANAVAFTIAERVQQHQKGRKFAFDKLYHRFEARLAPVPPALAERIPRFDPTAIHADTAPFSQEDGPKPAATRVIELLGGTVPIEDGQELDARDASEIVAQLVAEEPAAVQGASQDLPGPGSRDHLLARGALQRLSSLHLANTSDVPKSVLETNSVAADAGHTQASSLYASLYHTAQALNIPAEAVQQVLRIHTSTVDFTQNVSAGDTFELFFEAKVDGRARPGEPGNLLASPIATNGNVKRLYRFRTADGAVDYYDEHGATSRTLLIRQPVHCAGARVTSGFGVRVHPLLQVLRPHAGVDWACPEGTPIMAAGAGWVEEAGRRGEYGNYLRIRHANGYKTAYGHMSGFAPGLREGVRVRQGQIIGRVGTSGFTSGPHVHFEVLVQSANGASYRTVDPMSVNMPRERDLAGKDLADFQKERARIDRLLRAEPVSTRVAIGPQRR
jgi:murein DD-endopeptidase MepM/ murein hydrolase activator NlpD